MTKSDFDLKRFLNDYHCLNHWLNNENIRNENKSILKDRLFKKSFSIKELIDLFDHPIKTINCKIKILFAHFSPFEWELEGIGLPAYASLMLPNATIDFSYVKGSQSPKIFNINKLEVLRKENYEEKYDLIISRSSALSNMMNESQGKKCLMKSGFKINIKTMSYKPNYVYADYYFDEEDMCPPADPIFTKHSDNFIKKNSKNNLIIVSGSLYLFKNQLKMLQQLNPNIINDYKLVIFGEEKDKNYVKNVIDTCNKKNIQYYFLGKINKLLANEIMSYSKLSLIPLDPRPYGQPKGYPRVLGESISAKCLTLCNKAVTIPDFYRNSTITYDENIENNLNIALEKLIKKSNNINFFEKHKWEEKSFENVCCDIIVKCLSFIL